jgi:shikimate dehydrogenase
MYTLIKMTKERLITGKTKILGVIGHPIEHSLSPIMHNVALHQLGLDYIYLPWAIAPENLETAIVGFAAMGIIGFNVTIPHKQAILPLLSEITPIAQAIGAVNTVSRQADRWIGTNTDVEGFIAPLQTTYQQDWSQKEAVILGSGGAARAIVAGCIQLGLGKIHLVGRNWIKLQEFSSSWDNSDQASQLQIYLWENLPKLIPQANLLVNTTPVGMYPHEQDCPLTAEEMASISSGAIAYDLIYIPKSTKFLQLAAKQGAVTLNGLEMLVQQGAAALKIWLQLEKIPVNEMRQSLENYLA